MGIKGKDDVFIHILKAEELAKKEFREKGEISFLLSKGGFKKLKKLIDLEKDNFGTNRKRTLLSKIKFIFRGAHWFLLSLYGILFDERLRDSSSFYIVHNSVISEIQEHDYTENNKCKVVTFIRKKNPPVSWLSGIEESSDKAPDSVDT